MDIKNIEDLESYQCFTHHRRDTMSDNGEMRLKRMQKRSPRPDSDRTRKIVRNHLKLTTEPEDDGEKKNQTLKKLLNAYARGYNQGR